MRLCDQLPGGDILLGQREDTHGIAQVLPLRCEDEEEQLGLRFMLEVRREAVHDGDDQVGLMPFIHQHIIQSNEQRIHRCLQERRDTERESLGQVVIKWLVISEVSSFE